MALKTTKWNTVEYLQAKEDQELYLQACLEEAGTDAKFIASALGNIASVRGMASLSKETGLTREGLYKSLSGNVSPNFDTVLKVLHALGFELQIKRCNRKDSNNENQKTT